MQPALIVCMRGDIAAALPIIHRDSISRADSIHRKVSMKF
jgi:hypothetical protein